MNIFYLIKDVRSSPQNSRKIGFNFVFRNEPSSLLVDLSIFSELLFSQTKSFFSFTSLLVNSYLLFVTRCDIAWFEYLNNTAETLPLDEAPMVLFLKWLALYTEFILFYKILHSLKICFNYIFAYKKTAQTPDKFS